MERVGRFNPMQSVNTVSYPQLYITTIPTLLNNHTLPSSLNSAFFRSFAFLTSPANMSDQTVSISYVPSNYDSPTSPSPPPRQTVKLFTAATLGLVLLLLSGLTLTGTVISLIIATPLLVLFSPILVPAGLALFLLAAGFLFAGGCGVAAIAALSWIYNYVVGKNPPGSDRIDFAGAIIADKARDKKERSNQGL